MYRYFLVYVYSYLCFLGLHRCIDTMHCPLTSRISDIALSDNLWEIKFYWLEQTFHPSPFFPREKEKEQETLIWFLIYVHFFLTWDNFLLIEWKEINAQ